MGLPDAPAVVLVALTLSAILFLVEVALPTMGVAGFTSVALVAVAVVAAGGQEHPWWPLLFVVAGVSLWAVLLAGQWESRPYRLVAAGMFAVGGVGYGILAGDPVTVALAAAGSVALPFTYRPLHQASSRLRQLPPQLGMEALVGRPGTVVRWDDGSGTVRIDGSLWSARSNVPLQPGTCVVVDGYKGMRVHVTLSASVS